MRTTMRRTTRWTGARVGLLAAAAALAAPVGTMATPIVIDAAATSGGGFSCTGSVTANFARVGLVGGFENTTTGTATYAPGLPPGDYFVEVNYYSASSYPTAVNYTVNAPGGSQTVTLNQRLTAGQGTANSVHTGTSSQSGWINLGQFSLDAGSTLTVNAGGSIYSLDGVMFRPVGDGLVIDEMTATVDSKTTWPDVGPQAYANSANSVPGLCGQYSSAGANKAYYALGAVTGQAQVAVSWVTALGTTTARYILDPDGVLGNGDDVTMAINQNKLADQVTTDASRDWSGFAYFGGNATPGTYALGPNSRVVLDSNGTTRVSADAVLGVPVPEPAGLGLLALGALGLRRRKR